MYSYIIFIGACKIYKKISIYISIYYTFFILYGKEKFIIASKFIVLLVILIIIIL